MAVMKHFRQLAIKGLFLITLCRYSDHRGWYKQLFDDEEYLENGVLTEQDRIRGVGLSLSRRRVVRAFHIARYHKIIHVIRGRVLARIMDCDPDSPTFGLIVTVKLSPYTSLVVPPHCGNGFQCQTLFCLYMYFTTGRWRPGVERGVSYKEVRWPLHPIVSKRDKLYKPFRTEFRDAIRERRRRKIDTPQIVPPDGCETVWVRS